MKRIGLLLAMPLAAAGLFFGGCREAKKKNCRELFYRHYEAQVKGFMRAMLDTDTVLARKRAAFALKRAYEIDSAFVWMEGAQLTEFLDSIRLVIREEIARIR